jgi:chemotaxis response regulator CheB
MQRTRVLIVDDSLTIRAMFEEMLLSDPEIDLIGAAGSAEEALDMLSHGVADVIALDLHMPGLGGIAFLDQIKGHWHKMAVVIVSSAAVHKSEVCTEAFAHGAAACFDKSRLIANGAQMRRLLKEAATGDFVRAAYRGDTVTLPTRSEANAAARAA